MINRVFFISDIISENVFPSGAMWLQEENVYYSIQADPHIEGSLDQAYTFIKNAALFPVALTLSIRKPLTTGHIRDITSFLFVPSYLSVEYRQVINLAGEDPKLLSETAMDMSAYLSSQGILNPLIHILSSGRSEPVPDSMDPYPSFHSGEILAGYYRRLLEADRCYDNSIFFYAGSGDTMRSAFLSLWQAEVDFKQQSPKLYALLATNRSLKKELNTLQRKQAYTEIELNNQKQYLDILRSDHAAHELQDYYTREYEILPLWFKRLGHLVKVLTGKRTFRSLFRDDVKKYKV